MADLIIGMILGALGLRILQISADRWSLREILDRIADVLGLR